MADIPTNPDPGGSLSELRASEVRYRRLFETARDGILILGAVSGTIIDANPYIAELMGFSRDELIGKDLWQLGLFKDVAATKAMFAKLQRTGYVRYDDLPLQAKDGHSLDVEFVSNRYHANGDTVIQCNIRDISERKRRLEAILQEASTDSLTGVSSRRSFVELANKELQRFKRHRHPLSLLMLDVDHFKSINDQYGHLVGDLALQMVARAIAPILRTGDVVGRLGGEEFAVLMPETPLDSARAAAERVRTAISVLAIPRVSNGTPRITVSIGLAAACQADEDIRSVIERADTKLYEAKHLGRDRVCV